MKKIEATVRKSRYSDVKSALHEVGIDFFTYWDVTGIGNETSGHVYRGVSYSSSDIQRRTLSIICNDEFVQPCIDAILKAAYTGEVGDGKIFVIPVEESIRIRTGEKGGVSLK